MLGVSNSAVESFHRCGTYTNTSPEWQPILVPQKVCARGSACLGGARPRSQQLLQAHILSCAKRVLPLRVGPVDKSSSSDRSSQGTGDRQQRRATQALRTWELSNEFKTEGPALSIVRKYQRILRPRYIVRHKLERNLAPALHDVMF